MAVKHKKLLEWVSAGLMTGEQADSIHAYEEARKSGRFGRGLIGLSLFAILIGVLSIIAANWNEISGDVKIGAHVLLNAGVGFFALWSHKKGQDLWREGATFAFLGLTFTLIILIGQVFQMTGTPADAALFWLIITLPFFLLLGRGYMTAVPWMMAFLATIWLVVFDKIVNVPQEQKTFLVFSVVAILPLALMVAGGVERFRNVRTALCNAALRMGLLLSVCSASVCIGLWPADRFLSNNGYLLTPNNAFIILSVGCAGLVMHAFAHEFYKKDLMMKSAAIFALVSLLATIIPLILSFHDAEILPALVFIGYWVFIGWLAQGMHHIRLVSLAITIIAIRIFVVYVEVFGSLMTTGFGLISGGVVMLGLIYAARRLNKRMTTGGVSA